VVPEVNERTHEWNGLEGPPPRPIPTMIEGEIFFGFVIFNVFFCVL
jgi:hypothetical protein